MELKIESETNEEITDLAVANLVCRWTFGRTNNPLLNHETNNRLYDKSIRTIAYAMLATVDNVKFDIKE